LIKHCSCSALGSDRSSDPSLIPSFNSERWRTARQRRAALTSRPRHGNH